MRTIAERAASTFGGGSSFIASSTKRAKAARDAECATHALVAPRRTLGSPSPSADSTTRRASGASRIPSATIAS
jgi:hypothetical protein